MQGESPATITSKQTNSYDEAARKEALNKEYQKDFFAEGQYFYFLKRHNYKTFWRCPVEKMDYYVLPTPDDEIAIMETGNNG